MRAMVLNAASDLTSDEHPVPEPGTHERLVRVTHSGVCGTDLKIYRGGIPVEYPRIMGHEMIGVLEGAGADSEPPSGARVIIDPVGFCGHCHLCRSGKDHLCHDGYVLGRDRDGGFADYMLAPSSHIFPLPENIDDTVAPLLQVFTTCVHAQRLVDIFPGQAVVVLGLGVSGQLHVQLAKARGASPVIGITRSAERRELARSLGADEVLAPGDLAAQRVRELTDGRGADLVIEAVGNASVLAQAIDLAATGGSLLLFGIYTSNQIELPMYQLYFKELAIINARAARREDYPAAIDYVERGAVQLEPLVSHVLPLAELGRAVTMLEEKDDARMKVILEHG